MRRVIGAVAAAAAASIAASVAVAAAMVPAIAATRSADHTALAHSAAQGTANVRVWPIARDLVRRRTLPEVIASEFGGGKYVTVVRCSGTVDAPPPVLLAKRGDPLTVRGARPTAAVIKLLAKPRAYKTVYSCTVVVEVKVPAVTKKTHVKKGCALGAVGGGRRGCHRVIIVNTGFGGDAGTVSGHHPAS